MVACLLGRADIAKALLEARADTDMKEKVLLARTLMLIYIHMQVHVMTNIIVWYHAVV